MALATRALLVCCSLLLVALSVLLAGCIPGGRDSDGPAGTTVQATSRTRITHDGVSLLLAISPDHRSLLYRDMGQIAGPGGTVWRMSVDGRHKSQLAPGQVEDATFLPDGRHILYQPIEHSYRILTLIVSDLYGRTQHVFHLGVAELIQRAEGGSLQVEPNLSLALLPDGHIVVYRGNRLLDVDVVHDRVTPFGPPVSLVVLPGTAWVQAAISPNRELLANPFPPAHSLFVQSLVTGRVVWRLSDLGGIDALAWSPNSRTLAYVGGWFDGAIRAVDVDTGGAWLLARIGMNHVSSFAWSPNGGFVSFDIEPSGTNANPSSRILFISRDGKRQWWMDRDGTGRQPGETDIVWSSRARMLGYTRDYGGIAGPERNDIYVVRLE